ncbi:hypothetical protein [Cupriavidus plantarum]|uniref:DUF465 domain-containing protein n=1 Tax=Cupriavidus plantarum TaxID=942865 RepID=A0A316EVV8_9BURK|nr:hypothetical protein [Cupriavidus plantarum]PWK36804.1 hypothetical protein C7419_101671 [Cupriavidus plantarum]
MPSRNCGEDLAALEQAIAKQEGLLHDIEARRQADDDAAFPHDEIAAAEAVRLRQAIYVLKSRRAALTAEALKALRRD